jgi:hypothetical protein
MPGHPDELALLHHRLSGLRAHVEVARREVALAKRRPARRDGAFQPAKVMQAQGVGGEGGVGSDRMGRNGTVPR